MAHGETSAERSARTAEAVAVLGAGGTMGFAMARNIARAELGSDDNAELALFQSREITYRGQLVAAVVAGTLETARAAAAAIGNAVCHATGRCVRDLPITPAKLLE